MSRTAVLADIVAYLSAGTQVNNKNVSYLGGVYAQIPKWLNEGALYEGQGSGTSSGAFIWAWLGRGRERRRTLQGAPAGGKVRYFELKLQCVFVSTHDQVENAKADNDTFLDSLHTYIVASKVANGTGAVWQWAEGEMSFGMDYIEDPGDPIVVDEGVTHFYTAITITVVEQD